MRFGAIGRWEPIGTKPDRPVGLPIQQPDGGHQSNIPIEPARWQPDCYPLAEKVNEDPYGDGWMIKIKVTDSTDLDSLLSADDYNSLIGV